MKSIKGLTTLFIVGKCLYIINLFLASDFLHNQSLSIVSYVFLLLAGSGIIFMSMQRSWRTLQTLTRKQTLPMMLNATSLVVIFLLSQFGLKYAGALRFLFLGVADQFITHVPSLLCGFKTMDNVHRKRGTFVLTLAFTLLILAPEYSIHDVSLPDVSVLSSSLAAGVGGGTQSGLDLRSVSALASDTNIPDIIPVPVVEDAPASVPASAPVDLPPAVYTDTEALGANHRGARRLLHAGHVSDTDTDADADAASAEGKTLYDSLSNLRISTSPAANAFQAAHTFRVLFIDVSESTVGSFAVILATTVDMFRKSYIGKHTKAFGGSKRMHAASSLCAAALLAPFALIQFLFPGDISEESAAQMAVLSQAHEGTDLSFLRTGINLCLVIVFVVVLDFYVDTIHQRMQLSGSASNASVSPTKISFITSFVAAILVDWFRGEGRFTFITAVSGMVIYYGLHHIGKADSYRANPTPVIPVYSSRGGSSGSSKSSGWSLRTIRSQCKTIFKHLTSDTNTTRIFIFLSINFLFMFVELIYGFWTNSLGLVSDAGHMFFDCVALGIGLYASYIAQVKANDTYTYGYGRYEIMSGFINGVFLIFIAFFVFVESVERLYEEPEILSDQLILVSFLGFIVNMIGLIFFHDHSGHGHSHGGGGCGGHGGAPKKKEIDMDHSHSHHNKGHGHAHAHGGGSCGGGDDAQHRQRKHVHSSHEGGECGGHGHSDDHSDHSAHGGHGHSHGHGGCNGAHENGEHKLQIEPNSHDAHGHAHAHGGSCGHGHGHDAHEEDEDALDHHNHNMQGIFLHILADALGSVGVIISSILVHYFDWTSADAICSIMISVLILLSVIPFLQGSARILMQRMPLMSTKTIKNRLKRVLMLEDVLSYREAHFWSFSDDYHVGTLHVQVKERADEQYVLSQVTSILKTGTLEGSDGKSKSAMPGLRVGTQVLQNLTVQIEKSNFTLTLDPTSSSDFRTM